MDIVDERFQRTEPVKAQGETDSESLSRRMECF